LDLCEAIKERKKGNIKKTMRERERERRKGKRVREEKENQNGNAYALYVHTPFCSRSVAGSARCRRR
jgi:coproporphyrinogen III oxidase-like Fe-S oxidoreductase